MTKTEIKLLDYLKHKKYCKASVFGKREVNAAKKLDEKGLVKFTNQSGIVRNCIRRRNGDYHSVFVYQGYLEKIT